MADSANLGLPYIAASQAQKHVTHNEALRLLDGMVQGAVFDMRNTPPGGQPDGRCFIVTSGATGAWSGWVDSIAMWADGSWFRIVPKEGWLYWVGDENQYRVWDGSAWVTLASTLGL